MKDFMVSLNVPDAFTGIIEDEEDGIFHTIVSADTHQQAVDEAQRELRQLIPAITGNINAINVSSNWN